MAIKEYITNFNPISFHFTPSGSNWVDDETRLNASNMNKLTKAILSISDVLENPSDHTGLLADITAHDNALFGDGSENCYSIDRALQNANTFLFGSAKPDLSNPLIPNTEMKIFYNEWNDKGGITRVAYDAYNVSQANSSTLSTLTSRYGPTSITYNNTTLRDTSTGFTITNTSHGVKIVGNIAILEDTATGVGGTLTVSTVKLTKGPTDGADATQKSYVDGEVAKKLTDKNESRFTSGDDGSEWLKTLSTQENQVGCIYNVTDSIGYRYEHWATNRGTIIQVRYPLAKKSFYVDASIREGTLNTDTNTYEWSEWSSVETTGSLTLIEGEAPSNDFFLQVGQGFTLNKSYILQFQLSHQDTPLKTLCFATCVGALDNERWLQIVDCYTGQCYNMRIDAPDGPGGSVTIELTSTSGKINAFGLDISSYDDPDEVLKQYTGHYRISVHPGRDYPFLFESIDFHGQYGPLITENNTYATCAQYKEYTKGPNVGKRYRRLHCFDNWDNIWTDWEEIEQDSTTSSSNWVYSEKRNISSAETLWKTLFPDRAHLDNIYFSDSTDLSDNIDDYLNYMYKLHFYSDDNNDWVTSIRDIVGSGMLIGWIRHMATGGIYLYLLSLDGGTKAGTIAKWQISYDGLHVDNLTIVNNSVADSNLFQHVGGVVSLDGLDSIITEYGDRAKTYIFNFSNSSSNEHIIDDGLYIGRIVDTSDDVQLEFHSYIPDGIKYTYSHSHESVESEVVVDTVIDAGSFYKTENILKYNFINGRHYIMKLGSEISIDGTFVATYTEQKGYYPDPEDPYEQIYGTIKYLEGLCINNGKIYKLDLTNGVTVTSLNTALDDGVNYFTLSNHMDGDIDDMLKEYIGDNFIGFISPLNNSSYIFINHYNPNDNFNHQRKLYTDGVRSRRRNNLGEWTDWTLVSDYIEDAGEYFNSEYVEGALQEIGSALSNLPAPVIVDNALKSDSTNPVQNKVINTALNNKMNGIGSFATVGASTMNSPQILAYDNTASNKFIRFSLESLEAKMFETGEITSNSYAWWDTPAGQTFEITGTYQLIGDYCTLTATVDKVPNPWTEVSYSLPVAAIERSGTVVANMDDNKNDPSLNGSEVGYIISTGWNTPEGGNTYSTVHIKRLDGQPLTAGKVTFTLTYKYK